MEEINRPDNHPPSGDEGELMTLVELQKFLADELASSDSTATFQRAFLPLTDGLGLESPRPRETVFAPLPKPPKPETQKPAPAPQVPPQDFGRKVQLPTPPIPSVRKAIVDGMAFEPRPAKSNSLKVESSSTSLKDREPTLLEHDELPPIDSLLKPKPRTPVLDPEPEPEAEAPVAVPPPMPAASFFRRVQAVVIDQAFVLSLWAVALVITSRSLSRGTEPLLTRLLHDFSNPLFLRMAILEFVTLWLCYFAFGIGLLDGSFGMWVWGLRLSYGSGSRGFKKFRRILFSLIFLAPIVTSLLLVIRVSGKNLLDWISGTKVYRATA